MDTHPRPFHPYTLLGRGVPFAAAGAIAFLVALVPGDDVKLSSLITATLLTFATFAVAAAVSVSKLPSAFDLLPPLLYIGAAGAFRDALGGSGTSYEALFVLPVLWVALYHPGHHQPIGVLATVTMLIAPIVLVGGPAYPTADWRTVVLWTTVVMITGPAVHGLVARIRKLVRTDAATGLLNGEATAFHLEREFGRYRRESQRLTVAVFSIDGYEGRVGLLAARRLDRDLRRWAHAWSDAVRITNSLGRTAYNEYLLLMSSCDVGNALFALERVQRSVTGEQPSLSMGVVAWDGDATSDVLLTQARSLMAQARSQGGDQVVAGLPVLV